MKYIKSIFITLSILLSFTNLTFALDVCPGENKTLTWSSSNASICTPSVSGFGQFACNFFPTPNVASSSVVAINANTTSGNFCTVTLTCKNNAGQEATSIDSLNVKTLGWCATQGRGACPAGQIPDTTTAGSIYAGNGCITPTAIIVGGSCTIPVGASSCNVPVTFTTTNAVAAEVKLFNSASGAAVTNTVSVGGGTPIIIRADYATVNNIGQGTVTGNCATGSQRSLDEVKRNRGICA